MANKAAVYKMERPKGMPPKGKHMMPSGKMMRDEDMKKKKR